MRILIHAAWLLIAATSTAWGQPERPNILWLSTEDIGPHLACYGDPTATTPNLDSLARRGCVYDRAWSNFPVCAPARTTIITGMYAASNGAGNMRSNVPLDPSIEMFPALLRRAGYYCTNNSKEDYNHPKRGQVWDESSGKAHYRHRKTGQPFFAVFNFTGTHESKIRKRPHQAVIDPNSVPLPGYWPDIPAVRQDWAQYYDNLQTLDRWFGKKIEELKEHQLEGDTIVLFFGDHGSGMPRHKRFAGDSGQRVPLLVYVPQKWKHLCPVDYLPGGHSGRPVGFVDLAPTMLNLAGVSLPDYLQGQHFLGTDIPKPKKYLYGFRDRMDERPDFSRSIRDERFVYIRNWLPHLPAGQQLDYQMQTPTTRQWFALYQQGRLNEKQQAFWAPRDAEELYDLESDPEETVNLATDPEYGDTLQRFREELKSHTIKVGDLGFVPEPMFHRIAASEAVRDFAKDDTRYPLANIFEIAAGNAPGQLDSPNPIVRYWSAVREFSNPATEIEVMERFANDSEPSVAVVGAERWAGRSKPGSSAYREATDLLWTMADFRNSDYYAAVYALNALDRLRADGRPGIPTRDPTIKRGNNYLERLLKRFESK